MTNVHILTDSDRIEHSGVRGMKWGHRRARSSQTQRPPRKSKRQAKIDYANERLTGILEKAFKDGDKTLINLNNRGVVTGEQFVNYVSSGGLLDVKRTSIFAEYSPEKEDYVRSDDKYDFKAYQKSKK